MAERVRIRTGTNAGKFATVLEDLREMGRKLVYIDGHVASDGLRAYVYESLEPVVPAPQPPAPEPSPYRFTHLVYEDNFDVLDRSQWSLYDGDGHAGNGIRDPASWSIREDIPGATGRCLVGTAWWDAAHKSTTLRTGKVKTGPQMRTPGMSHVFDSAYHRMEVRSRVEPDPSDVTRSNLPLTWPKDQVHAEYNPWESSNAARYPMRSFFHYGTAGQLPQLDFEHDIHGDEWHTVMFERTPDYMKVWCDGALIISVTDKTKISTYPHHMCLQLDAIVNRDCGGARRAYVDRVRIWD